MTAQEWYDANLTDPECADVAEHLNTLKRYASVCESVVECGVWDCTTSVALLLGRPKRLRSIDIERRPEVDRLEECARELGVDFTFTYGSSFEVQPNACEMLYIDTWHNAEQLTKELAHWSPFVSRYILLHDTESHGDVGMFGGGGLWVAIKGFLKGNDEWRLTLHKENCLGLTCLMRVR